MHISTFAIPDTGEGSIDDLSLFSDQGALASVEHKWRAVTKYALLVDRSHSTAVRGLRAFLDEHSKILHDEADALDDLFVADEELRALSESDSFLVKSVVFLLLVAFTEYARKQIHQLLEPGQPPPERHAVKWVLTRLEAQGVLLDLPQEYETDFRKFCDPVRNNLAHGDWSALGKELHSLDLTKSFLAVAGYFIAIRQNLLDKNYDV